jgi:hypothetical protein
LPDPLGNLLQAGVGVAHNGQKPVEHQGHQCRHHPDPLQGSDQKGKQRQGRDRLDDTHRREHGRTKPGSALSRDAERDPDRRAENQGAKDQQHVFQGQARKIRPCQDFH